MDIVDTMHARLKTARRRAGFKSATAAITRFAWKGSTYRAHENGQNQFDTTTAKTYAAAFKTSASWLLTGEELKETRTRSGAAQAEDGGHVLVTGRVAGGEWMEEKIRRSFPVRESVFPADPRFPVEAQFDLAVHGDSIDLFAQDGDYLRCVDIAGAAVPIADGDLLIVERKTDSLTEISARRVRNYESGCRLVFQSTNELFQDSVTLDKKTRIIAKVLWKYRVA